MTINRIPTQNYTGQGFKGERGLAVASIVITIVSTLLLIDLTIKQRKHLKNEIEKSKIK
jgi:hypothetical protein